MDGGFVVARVRDDGSVVRAYAKGKGWAEAQAGAFAEEKRRRYPGLGFEVVSEEKLAEREEGEEDEG